MLVLALSAMGGWIPQATAYEVSSGTWSAPVGNSSSLEMPSGLTVTVTTSGHADVRAPSTLGSKGFSPDFFTPGTMGTGDPAIDIQNWLVGCQNVGTCSGLGTLTITFSQPVRNPTLHFVGLGGSRFLRQGGVVTQQSDLHSTLTLQTPGVTLEAVSGNDNFAVTDGVVTAVNSSASLSCITTIGSASPAGATASCGSARVNGTVTTLTFELGAVTVQNPSTPSPIANMANASETFGMTVTLPQDFADGPAAYDGTQAPAHVMSDLTLGADVSEDNAAVPNSTAGVDTDVTDAFDTLPDVVAEPGSTYDLSVPVAGVSQDAHVCGFLDLDHDGVFGTTDERACTTVAAGATSADLSWTLPTTVSVGQTRVRFRIGYIQAQVETPTGLAGSGEVEDYPLTVLARPQIILTKTTTGSAGGPFDYTLSNTTQSAGTATTSSADAATQVDGDPATDGAQPFTVTAAGSDVTIVESETTGWQVTDATCTTADGAVVGSLSGTTYTIPGSEVVGGAVITCGYTNAELVPALTLTKSDDGVTDLDGNGPDAGDSVAYSFAVTNTGETTLSDLTVTDPMVGDVSCPATTLDPGEVMTCTAGYVLTQADLDAGAVVNTATATGTPPFGVAVSTTDSVTVSLERTGGLDFAKGAEVSGRVSAGDDVPFTFTVTNTGNVTLSDITVTDPMTGAVTCPSTTLAPGDTVVCTAAPYTVTDADVTAGEIRNTAVVTALAAGSDDELTSEASVTLLTARALPRTGAPVSLAVLGLALGIGSLGAALTIASRRQRR